MPTRPPNGRKLRHGLACCVIPSERFMQQVDAARELARKRRGQRRLNPYKPGRKR
jgi:hypothetical protein